MEGKPIQGSLPESLRLFALCDAMKWAHLPVAGGIYDQHPQLIEEFQYIFNVKHKHEADDAAREAAKAKAPRKK